MRGPGGVRAHRARHEVCRQGNRGRARWDGWHEKKRFSFSLWSSIFVISSEKFTWTEISPIPNLATTPSMSAATFCSITSTGPYENHFIYSPKFQFSFLIYWNIKTWYANFNMTECAEQGFLTASCLHVNRICTIHLTQSLRHWLALCFGLGNKFGSFLCGFSKGLFDFGERRQYSEAVPHISDPPGMFIANKTFLLLPKTEFYSINGQFCDILCLIIDLIFTAQFCGSVCNVCGS